MNKPFGIIGAEGVFGKELDKKSNSQDSIFTAKTFNIENKEPNEFKSPKEISEEIKNSKDKYLFISIGTRAMIQKIDEKLFLTELGRAVYDSIFRSGKVAININSVQGPVYNEILEIFNSVENNNAGFVSIHPMHGPRLFNDLVNRTKNWIKTSVVGKTQKRTEHLNKIIKTVASSKINQEENYILHDIENMKVEVNGEVLSGPHLHDAITGYFQAVTHMLRLSCGDDEWFLEFIDEMDGNLDLSRGIIEQNPNAERVYQKYFSHISDIENSTERKFSALKAVESAMKEGNNLFSEDFPYIKTPKTVIMENKLSNEIMRLKV